MLLSLSPLDFAVVVVALAFGFLNGFHDAANSIATMVSTRVLTPVMAVAWAAFFNFIAFAVFPLHVASTIGSGVVHPASVDTAVILGALVGAIGWNLATWWWGLPSSSSHALIGGLLGAAICKSGFSILIWSKLTIIATFIVFSPALGLIGAGIIMVAFSWVLRRRSPGRMDRWFRRLQFVSSGALSLSHGGSDAQKAMGVIAVFLFSRGHLGDAFPAAQFPYGFYCPVILPSPWGPWPGAGASFGPWGCV